MSTTHSTAYIYDAIRTPGGKGKKDGSLHSIKPVSLLTGLMQDMQQEHGLETELIDDVVLGCVTPIGDQGSCIAKTAALAAGWDWRVSGVQLNRFCASGLEAVNLAAQKVRSRWEDLVVAGGVESMVSPPEHDITLEAAMFQAVREGEFLLYYQPIVDTNTRQIQCFETLMRWRHSSLGMASPVHLIPIAESNGLINLLGAWALKSACVQLKYFEEDAKRPLYISVNVSARQFRNDHFLIALDDALAFSGLPGEWFLLRIADGTLMIDPIHAESVVAEGGARMAPLSIKRQQTNAINVINN
jgi:hypothetical protein